MTAIASNAIGLLRGHWQELLDVHTLVMATTSSNEQQTRPMGYELVGPAGHFIVRLTCLTSCGGAQTSAGIFFF
jgi:hypothetical protein